MPPILEVDAVSKTFQIPTVHRDTVRAHVLDLFRPRPSRPLRVLDRVSFTVQRGETIGIMGRNGSGKSTLLKIIAGIYRADGGAVRLRAPLTSILELGLGWNPELDAVDNVYLLGSIMGLTLADIRDSLDAILDFAELRDFARLKLQHYSRGMAARLAYAVAFHAVRDVLLLDEIFAVGDAGFRARCEARYQELAASGHTVLVVSHDVRTITTFCHRALLLDGGRIVAEGDGDRICKAYLALMESTRGG
jgi:ABC-2 type transport system ATP-binding protein